MCSVGAPISRHLSDLVVQRAKAQHDGIWVPEDHLRTVWIGGLAFIHISITLISFVTAYVSGTVSLVINLICQLSYQIEPKTSMPNPMQSFLDLYSPPV